MDDHSTPQQVTAEPASSAEPPRDPAAILYPNEQPAPAEDGPPQEQEQVAAPESYRLTVPEGMTVDQELLGAATPVLRELGLNDEQASKLAPLAAQVQERTISTLNDEYAALRADWSRQTKADPHLGGERWPETQRMLSVALQAGGADSEFRKVMNQSGIGDHPAVIRVFRRLGEKIAAANGGQAPRQSPSDVLYPNDRR